MPDALAIAAPPPPLFKDKFNYLLASDTFAWKRLAHPSPSLAEHWENLQEFGRLRGLVMEFGQRLPANRAWRFIDWRAPRRLCIPEQEESTMPAHL